MKPEQLAILVTALLLIAVGVWYPTFERHQREQEAAEQAALRAKQAREHESFENSMILHRALREGRVEALRRAIASAKAVPTFDYPARPMALELHIQELRQHSEAMHVDRDRLMPIELDAQDLPLVDAAISSLDKALRAIEDCRASLLGGKDEAAAIKEVAEALADARKSYPVAITALQDRLGEVDR